jgi:hypothetical protein
MPHVTPPDDLAGDRIDEAWAWLSAQLKGRPVPAVLALIGLGEAHLLRALDRYAPETRVLAVEPDPANAARLRSSSIAQAWIDGGRLALLAGPDYAGADDAWRLFPGTAGAAPVLVHPSIKPTPAATQAARVLKQILAGVAANREARRKFAPRYLVNSLRNVPAIVAGSDVRRLADAYAGVPAVIAAAGPSLDAAVPRLRDVRKRAVLIACDTALRPLLVSGIAPHLVVGVDPSELNARHMLALPECADTWLVSESALDRAATAPFDGRTFWFRVSNHEPWPWLDELGLDIGHVDVWGSVLTAAFQVACLAGCDPVVIAGADLSYTGGRPYARGTTYEFDWALATAGGMPLEQVWQQQISAGALTTVPDLRGEDTIATESLVSFRDWLVARAARSGRRVVNASGNGILAGVGVEQDTIAGTLTRTFDIPSAGRFARRPSGVRPSRLAARLREAHAIIASPESTHPLLARWKEFSGDGFDPSPIASALDEAAESLEAAPVKAVDAIPLVPWTDLSATVPAPTLFTQLSEATARLRVAMTGAPTLPAIEGSESLTDDDRKALLRDALGLLGRIRDELWRNDDLAPMMAPWDAGQRPASVVCAWPERLRWAVEVFEGMLGRAWTGRRADGRLPNAFFTLGVTARDEGGAGIPVPRPNSTHACLLLAREWLECWGTLEANDAVRESLARLSGLEAVLREPTLQTERPSVLTLRAGGNRSTASFELVLPVGDAALGRVLTGAIVRAAANAREVEPPRVDTPGLHVSLSLAARDHAPDEPPRTTPPIATRRPRLVSPPGERWAIAYPLERGVVCVRANDKSSVVVHEDGHHERRHRWPRAIITELPFGDGGAVAWASGRADPSDIVPPYVMYRRTAGDDPVMESLPFNPSWGAWWNGRVYWGYLPSTVQPGRGLASWAPSGDARIELEGEFALFDIRPDQSGLLLEPSTRRLDNSYERRLLSRGWRWHPSTGIQSRQLGPHGAAGFEVVANGITTTTYPEADLVTFERAGSDSLSMIVYHPFRVAWLGRSLLVCTVDGQLLLFENLLDDLSALC